MAIGRSTQTKQQMGGKKLSKSPKIAKVMKEFKAGKLHTGSKKGAVVKNPKQAIAIALSEARAGKKK